jgi:hypothetical protein
VRVAIEKREWQSGSPFLGVRHDHPSGPPTGAIDVPSGAPRRYRSAGPRLPAD